MYSPKRCFGLCIPGVSIKTYWFPFTLSIPFIVSLVVPALSETIATFSLTSLFISVDFPTLGLPTTAINPAFI